MSGHTKLRPTRAYILDEIRRLAGDLNGEVPGVKKFERLTGIGQSDWLGIYWARWGDALQEAGFTPNEWQGELDEQALFQALADAISHYGRVPTKAEWQLLCRQRDDLPSYNAMVRRYGSKAALISAFRRHALGNVTISGLVELLPAGDADEQPQGRDAPKPDEGLVYLLRSGTHYKIGRSSEIERRVKQVAVALPEPVTLVHAIRTDDPAGIEAYWHRRFADRRANGEWFTLSASDVAAFRRRKFQ